MKKLGITVLVIVVLIVIALLVAPAFIDVNSFHGTIQAQLQKRLGRNVTLGQLHLSLLPPAFRADNVMIADDPAFNTSRPFAQARQLSVHVAFWPLLSKQVQVTELELTQPQIELIKNSAGQWNFSTLGQSPQSSASQNSAPNESARAQAPAHRRAAPQTQQPQQTASAPAQSGSSSAGNLALNDLVISDGSLAITDEQAHQPRSVYDHIDLELSNYAPGQAFDLTAAAHLPGANNQQIKLSGTAGPVDQATPANTPAKLNVKMQNVSISGLQKFMQSSALAGDDAVISGSADVQNAPNSFASSGDLMLENVVLHGHSVGYPIKANYAVSSQGKQLRIDKGDLRLGSTPLAISGTVNTEPTPAQIDLRLNARDVSLQEIARLAAAAGIAFNPDMNVAGQLNADLTAQGATSSPALNGNLSASNINISGKSLPTPVSIPAIQLALTPQQISSNPFTASTGGTALNVQFALSNYTGNAPNVDATIRTSNANLGEFLNIVKAYGVSALQDVTGSGSLSLDVHAAGPVKDSSAMTFSGSGKLANAQIKSSAITQPLNVRNADLNFSQNSAILQNLQAAIGSSNANGNLTLHNFSNPQVQFALNVDKVDVAQLQSIFGVASPTPAKTAEDFWSLVPRANAAIPPAGGNQPGMLARISGSGTLSAGSVIYQGMTLTNLRSNVALDRGIIHLAPVTAQVFGGQETGTITIDARPTPMTYTVNAKLSNVDANQLLSSVSNAKDTLYGALNANADTSFSSGNGDLIRSLNGNMDLNLLNGKLAHVNLLQQLAGIGKFLSPGSSIPQGSFTNLVKLAGTFAIRNGVAETNNLQADLGGANLAGTGAIDLAAQTLNMRVTAVISKAMSQALGGTNIGGYMNTALANKNGELVMPVIVTGLLSSPHVAPDVEQIARMKLQNLLPTSGNPGALTSGILGAVMGKNQNGGKGNAVQNILQSLGRPNTAPNGMPQSDQSPNQQKPPNQQQPPQQQQPQQQQQQQASPWQNLLNNVLKKKGQQQQQQNPPPQNPQ